MNDEPVLRTVDLQKTYDSGDEALKGVSLEIPETQITAMVGPSGAGKSTFIRCVNRLVEPTSGEVFLNGTEITGLSKSDLRSSRRDIGMIFQEFNLVERLTVMENIMSGRLGYLSTWKALRRKYPPEDIKRARTLLDRVGLQDMENKRADALSGGQRQRVGIARAVMQEPEILLVDEPTSSLDPETSSEVMSLFREMVVDSDIPALVNIHEVHLAREYADRIVGLRDGELVFDGTPEEFDDEAEDLIYRGERPEDKYHRLEEQTDTGEPTAGAAREI